MDEIEPAGMWKSYTTSNQAVAIQSTYNKLVQSFEGNNINNAYIGKVKYIDYKKDHIPLGNAFEPILYKRHNFKHESELRAAIVDFSFLGTNQEPGNGHRVVTNLEKLVEEIRIAPTAPDWFKNLVQITIEKFGLKKPIINSELDETPHNGLK